MQARYCGGNRRRGKWKSRGVRFVTVPMLHRYPAGATCAKIGEGRVEGSPWGIPQLLHYSRRYLVRLLARQFALLYYKERRIPLGRVQKCSARVRRRRPTLRNRRARLSTAAEMRQLDKTASETSRFARINPDGIVASVRSNDTVYGTLESTRISTLFTKSHETHNAQLNCLNIQWQ